jgi:hypothetical protein
MVEISMYGSERAPGAVPRCYSRPRRDSRRRAFALGRNVWNPY